MSSPLPTLSVIVPNYNHSKYLDLSLPSVLKQSCPPLEVIVLDDASTDNSVEVIQRYAAQFPVVRLVRNEKNLGVVPNMNKGVELSRGEYVYVAPADDEVLPGLFERSLRLLAEHRQAALCCAIAEWFETYSGLRWHMAAGMAEMPCYLSPEEMIRLAKRERLSIISSTCLMRKDALRAAGSFIPELRWHTDWFACYVTGFRHGVCFVPEILSRAHLLPGSFYQAGHKKAQHLEVLCKLLALVNSRPYADVMPRIRDSGVLSLFSLPLLWLVLGNPEYRHLFNLTLLRKTLRRSAELKAKQVFPAWLSRWCLDRFYRAHRA